MIIGHDGFMELLRVMGYFENGDYSRLSPSNGIVVWKGQDLGEDMIRLVWLKQRMNKGESWTWTKIRENHEC